MPTREHAQPKGEIILTDSFYESSSTHIEISEKQSLKVSGGKIVFEDLYEKLNFYKMGRGERHREVYEIEISKLIELIKEYGQKTSQKN